MGLTRPAFSSIASPAQAFSDERLLLRELTHRINNEYASAIALVTLTAARSANEEVRLTLAAVLDRLNGYANVHRALEMPAQITRMDAAAYLRQLCRSISRSRLEHRGIELVLLECPLELQAEDCWRLGMIVTELVMNASRHAFGSGGGTVRVELATVYGAVMCRVSDDGAAPPEVRPGRGSRIIEGLVRSLDGRLERQFGPKGSSALVMFPIPASAPACDIPTLPAEAAASAQ